MSNLQAINNLVALLAGLNDGSGVPLFAAVFGVTDQEVDYSRIYHRAHCMPLTFYTDQTMIVGKIVVVLTFEIEITTAYAGTAEDADQVLDGIMETVSGATNGANLGTGTLPQLTRIISGRYYQYGKRAATLYPDPQRGERRMWLTGQLAWIRP